MISDLEKYKLFEATLVNLIPSIKQEKINQGYIFKGHMFYNGTPDFRFNLKTLFYYKYSGVGLLAESLDASDFIGKEESIKTYLLDFKIQKKEHPARFVSRIGIRSWWNKKGGDLGSVVDI